ncbi:FmdB family zinc ribbon protein [Streptomyces sp. NPDC003631]|uniref:FmdB family zinc ribbon protein n=3 Tax=Streptomyces TaxID=1883 RepID=UPI003CD09376
MDKRVVHLKRERHWDVGAGECRPRPRVDRRPPTCGVMMATYEYLCSRCGPFDVKMAIGTALPVHGCPACSGTARRVFSSPGLATTPHAVAALHDRQEQSREAPEVVSEVPPGRAPVRRPHPALSRLPRP